MLLLITISKNVPIKSRAVSMGKMQENTFETLLEHLKSNLILGYNSNTSGVQSTVAIHFSFPYNI